MIKRALLIFLILFGLLPLINGCNRGHGRRSYGFNPPAPITTMGPKDYTLTILEGNGAYEPAYLSTSGPVILNYFPLVVEVRNYQGALVNDIGVKFIGTSRPDGTYVGPLGLGTSISGTRGTVIYPARLGHAITIAYPYSVGPQYVTAQVLPAYGTSNIVTFTIVGY